MAFEVNAMETKKQNREENYSKEAGVERLKIRDWIESVKQEIRTIHWTTKDELKVYTQIVVGATFLFGIGVYFVDLVISGTLGFLTWLSRLIIG